MITLTVTPAQYATIVGVLQHLADTLNGNNLVAIANDLKEQAAKQAKQNA